MTSSREPETPLKGGWVTAGVVRVGDTVRRPVSASSSFTHRLLRHLEAVRFDAAPRLLGIDEDGREILTFVEGEVPSDSRGIVWADAQLSAAAELLRRFHDATAGTDLAGPREVVCHNDFGPWNLVWREGRPVAIIDLDAAAPGERIDDLGYAIWKHLNLGLVDLAPGEQGRRMRVMVTAYGAADSSELLPAIERAQQRMEEKLEASAPALVQLRAEREWVAAHRAQLQVSVE